MCGHRHAVRPSFGRDWPQCEYILCGQGVWCWCLGRWLGTRRASKHPVAGSVLCRDQLVEGQIVTPHFIGRTMDAQSVPDLSLITFWLWAWGRWGLVAAYPADPDVHSCHAVPSKPMVPSSPAAYAKHDGSPGLLANAARPFGGPRRRKSQTEAQGASVRAARGTAPSAWRPPLGSMPASCLTRRQRKERLRTVQGGDCRGNEVVGHAQKPRGRR